MIMLMNYMTQKQQATEENNQVLRKISKLLLNTLYGRMGMRNEFFKAKIVNKKDLDKLLKSEIEILCLNMLIRIMF